MDDVLFGADDFRTPKSNDPRPVRKRVLITVKAAPNPSTDYGETVCIAGLELDPTVAYPRWIRLYPVNFRHLDTDDKFKKYQVIDVGCVPAHKDQRVESWNPRLDTMVRGEILRSQTTQRRNAIEPMATDTMCDLYRNAKSDPTARSLGLCRPASVTRFEIRNHPGWTPQEQAKIDAYVGQTELINPKEKRPLQAPEFQAWYHWRCRAAACAGHRSMLLDWEFVALQRRLRIIEHRSAQDTVHELERRFFTEMCGPNRFTAFYVGNQAKRHQTFSIIGVYAPPLR